MFRMTSARLYRRRDSGYGSNAPAASQRIESMRMNELAQVVRSYLHKERLVLKFPRAFIGAVLLLAALLVLGLLAVPAEAAGARRGVHTRPGEFVLVRAVPDRSATRKQPPGLATIIDPSVRPEMQAMLGDLELDDAAFSALSGAPAGILARGAVGGALKGAGLLDGSPQGVGGAPAIATGGPGGVLGAVGGATRGIGNQVAGALQGAGLIKGGG